MLTERRTTVVDPSGEEPHIFGGTCYLIDMMICEMTHPEMVLLGFSRFFVDSV